MGWDKVVGSISSVSSCWQRCAVWNVIWGSSVMKIEVSNENHYRVMSQWVVDLPPAPVIRLCCLSPFIFIYWFYIRQPCHTVFPKAVGTVFPPGNILHYLHCLFSRVSDYIYSVCVCVCFVDFVIKISQCFSGRQTAGKKKSWLL